MHLIIDIRSSKIEDIYTIRYAVNWVKKWKQRNSEDTCTFLIFENQEAPEWENFFKVRPSSWLSGKRKIISKNENEIFRCINFSSFPPYDPEIPTISHIFDMAKIFYDSETNANILKRKEQNYNIKKFLKNSSHIIVPNFFTGNELVELWWVSESDVDIFPFIELENISEEKTDRIENLGEKFFIFDATFGPESNIGPMLEEFAIYRKKWWKFNLCMHGNSSLYLTQITNIIRELQIEKNVKILWNLTIWEQEALYNQASGWIFVGWYNTTKTNIALARTKKIPIILSDIPAFNNYKNCIKIHPNHLELLSDAMMKIQKNEKIETEEEYIVDENLFFAEYKNILSRNNNIKNV